MVIVVVVFAILFLLFAIIPKVAETHGQSPTINSSESLAVSASTVIEAPSIVPERQISGKGGVVYRQVSNPEVEEMIKRYSQEFGVDSDKAIAIAKAESGIQNIPNHLYTNESGKYTAYGIFQIISTTFEKNECGDSSERMNVEKNVKCAIKIMSIKGYGDWSESQSAWK